MDTRRSVSCSFWMDDWVEQLTPSQKLLFLYLLTSPSSNILGIYKISIQRISFETGMDKATIEKALKDFESSKKVFYIGGYIVMVNHLKHQALNPNMKVNIVKDFKLLPNELKTNLQINESESFESLSKALEELKTVSFQIEREIESEIEEENSEENFEKFWNLYNKKVGDKQKILKKWRKLTTSDREKIFATLPAFLANISDKQFQPYPETYLNNKRWNDEQPVPVKTESDLPKRLIPTIA